MNHFSPFARRTRRHGFTLVEMLIVIAVVGILAAILFPVFARVRENGRKTACMSNMKQLGLAFQQYSFDNGRKYPKAGNFQAWADGGHWVKGNRNYANSEHGLAKDQNGNFEWNKTASDGTPGTVDVEGGALYNYVKTAASFVCPSTENARDKRLGYSMNCALANVSDVRIRNPGDMVLLVDEGKSLNDGYFWAVDTSADAQDLLTKAHNGGGNLLFADYHVKFFPFDKFPLDGSPEGQANKARMTGSPRFHDLTLPKNGKGECF